MKHIGHSRRRIASAHSALGLAVFLAACGGGGGGGVPFTPSQIPPPAPTPTPTPTPNPSFDTAEYRRSSAATFAGALTAYTRGATGAGVKIAVIDSGVDIDSAEFAGRIDAASRDIAGTRGVDDQSGHGTSVSAVALAAKNDSEIQGIAFASTLIALRTDTPGTCAGTDGCTHADNNLATAVDVAVSAGARVINLSLGGSAANTRLRNAIANATAAGVILIISAGNEGETATGANPDPLAQLATDAAVARGRILIAGSVNSAGVISAFSNRAGNGSQYYLAALGEGVRSFDHTGTAFIYGGTSYATPGLSAAVALIAQAFPNLTADQIIDLLFTSARDAGAVGIDTIYGRGILDLAKAFTPQGGLSLAGSAVPVLPTSGSVAVVGGALGDAGRLGAALGGVIILDGYNRAFVADLSDRVARAAPQPKLGAALAMNAHETGNNFGAGSYSLSFTAPASRRPWVGLAQSGMDAAVNEDARVTRGFVSGRMTPTSTIGFAAGYGADDLLARMNGQSRTGSFIAGGDVLRDDGLALQGTTSAALAQKFGDWTLGIAAAEGRAAPLVSGPGRAGNNVRQFAASLARRVGAAAVTLTYSGLDEARTILGAEGSAALGATHAASHFIGVDGTIDLGGGWAVGAAARAGLTRLALSAGGLIADAAPLRSFAFSADIARSGVLTANDRLALRVSQPLRVEGGSIRLDVPASYDYATLGIGYERRVTTLAPSGREIDIEAAWSLPLAFGRLDSNVYWRRDPGHIDALADDIGAALRLTTQF